MGESETDNWTCPNCGRKENDSPPHSEMVFADGEITADVTCESVYLIRDDGYGIAFNYKEFEQLIGLFNEATSEIND